jgi:nitroreductase
MSAVNANTLSMPIGEAMFSQRSVRRLKSDPVPMELIHLILEAAVKAPNGGNRQPGRFLVVTDRARIKEFGTIYHDAWWAKRKEEKGWTKKSDIPADDKSYTSAAVFADEIGEVPAIVFAFTVAGGGANSILPACQNLMLAAHALGLGSVPTTLHPTVMDRFREMFDVPKDSTFHFCIPLGYPRVELKPSVRRPTAETCYLDRWDGKVPWA